MKILQFAPTLVRALTAGAASFLFLANSHEGSDVTRLAIDTDTIVNGRASRSDLTLD